MKSFLTLALFVSVSLLFTGCATEKLPSEDIEVLEKYSDIISVLKNPAIPPNSKEKYDAAKKLLKYVDLRYTRETATVNKLFHYGDAAVDAPNAKDPVFTFNYQYQNKYVRIRFFTCMMFITRVEIKENE